MSSLVIYTYHRQTGQLSAQEHAVPEQLGGTDLGQWINEQLQASEACFDPGSDGSADCEKIATAYRFDDFPSSWCVTEPWPGMQLTYADKTAAAADWEKVCQQQ